MVSHRRPRSVRTIIAQVHECVARGAVRITLKAQDEMNLLEPLADFEDVLDVLDGLTPNDWERKLVSFESGEAMHVFKPSTVFGVLYVKIVIRAGCIVVSFHEDREP